MGQVPTLHRCYLIIGGGRLATHLAHYFSLLDIPYCQWTRQTEHPLSTLLNPIQKVLLAVWDDAIEPLAKPIPNKTLIHFSGVLSTKLAEGAHPLFTFGPDLYDLVQYKFQR